MELNEETEATGEDLSPAVSLEISAAAARKIDGLLQIFAEDAGLTSAIVVDRSGAVVTGISAESDVTMDVISALVAGAAGAMRALIKELGDSGEIESLHQSKGQMVYLSEVAGRFVLAGLSDASQPVGLVRLKAQQIKEELSALLAEVASTEVSLPQPVKTRSLRAIALERAAARTKESEPEEITSEETLAATEVEESVVEEHDDEIVDLEEELPVEVVPSEPKIKKKVAPEPVEPIEIHEPLEDDDLEIIIEDSPDDVSAAEIEPDEPEVLEEAPEPVVPAAEPVESIFELEMDDDDDDEPIVAKVESEPIELIESEEESEEDEDPESGGSIFEFDEEDDDEEVDFGAVAPISLEEPPEEAVTEDADEDEESGAAPSSGPFYF